MSNLPANTDHLKQYEQRMIRTHWDEAEEKWYFAIVDVIAVLTDSVDPQNYWRVLKKRLRDEGNETITNCNGLKMLAADCKMRKTDVADVEQLLRLVQSIPSPKAEPFKLWLAQVGSERILETIDPELSIDRALETYVRKGYSREWINQRLQAIQVRKELTDEWPRHLRQPWHQRRNACPAHLPLPQGRARHLHADERFLRRNSESLPPAARSGALRPL